MTKINLVSETKHFQHKVFNPELNHRCDYVHQNADFIAYFTIEI